MSALTFTRSTSCSPPASLTVTCVPPTSGLRLTAAQLVSSVSSISSSWLTPSLPGTTVAPLWREAALRGISTLSVTLAPGASSWVNFTAPCPLARATKE
jgi:hypothetical protein